MPLPLVVRIDADDTRSAESLKKLGGRDIEILITYEWAKTRFYAEAHYGISAAKPEDVDACAKIAVKTFKFSRFHADPMIPKEVADGVKDSWVRRAFTERKKKIFVSCSATGQVTGFIIVYRDGGCGVVDLLGVHPDHKRRGIGTRLLRHAMLVMDMPFRAGTQAGNKAAKDFYKRNGFTVAKKERTFHFS